MERGYRRYGLVSSVLAIALLGGVASRVSGQTQGTHQIDVSNTQYIPPPDSTAVNQPPPAPGTTTQDGTAPVSGDASRVDRVVVGSAGGDQITVVDARSIAVVVDLTGLPIALLPGQPDPGYVPPQLMPEAVQVPVGAQVQLSVRNGVPPYRLFKTQPHSFPSAVGAGTTDSSWVVTAVLASIHRPDDRTPQLYIATDAYGRRDTASVTVFPPVMVTPSSGAVYSGNGIYVSASGGSSPGAAPSTFDFAENGNLSGGTIVPDASGMNRVIYTPGPTTGVTDILVARDSDGNQAQASFEVKVPLTIVEANGAPPAEGVVRLTVGQVLQFHGAGGTGEGYRWGNYNSYSVNNGVEYGNGTLDSVTGEYTARKAGEDQVYVNDSANNAYTIKVEIQ